MGVRAGKDGSIKDGSNTIGYIDSWQFDQSVDLHDVTAIGDDDRKYVAGLRDSTVTFQGTFDSTNAGQAAVIGEILSTASVSTHTLVLIYNNATGSVAGYTGSAFINAKSIGSPKDGKQSFSGSATYSGGVSAYSTT